MEARSSHYLMLISGILFFYLKFKQYDLPVKIVFFSTLLLMSLIFLWKTKKISLIYFILLSIVLVILKFDALSNLREIFSNFRSWARDMKLSPHSIISSRLKSLSRNAQEILTPMMTNMSIKNSDFNELKSFLSIGYIFSISGYYFSSFERIIQRIFKNRIFSQVIIIFIYAWMLLSLNFSIPALKSCFSYGLRNISSSPKGQYHDLSIAFIVFLVIDQSLVNSLGFLLSFLGSFALLTFPKKTSSISKNFLTFLVVAPLMLQQGISLHLFSPLIGIFLGPFVLFLYFILNFLIFLPELNFLIEWIAEALFYILYAFAKMPLKTGRPIINLEILVYPIFFGFSFIKNMGPSFKKKINPIFGISN